MAIDAQEAAIEHSHSGSGQATNASLLQRLKASLASAAGTIVFGMEDGTVSIFGLILGVAATTSSTATVLIWAHRLIVAIVGMPSLLLAPRGLLPPPYR
jgi:hypothetical protein